MSTPIIVIIMGRSGSGKGTQAEFLQKEFDLKLIRASALIKERGKNKDYTGVKLIETMEQGIFVPGPFVISSLMKELERVQEEGIGNGLILDGIHRKLYEAYMVDEAFEWYQWDNVKVVNIEVSEEEVTRRLTKRGRSDDDAEGIKNRLRMYDENVRPVLEYYRKKGIRLDINGEQTQEEVYDEIKEKLGL
tara:strand:- start:64 stop:636 length:573 start_codon:yes stop_codon:yes gene_type:complete